MMTFARFIEWWTSRDHAGTLSFRNCLSYRSSPASDPLLLQTRLADSKPSDEERLLRQDGSHLDIPFQSAVSNEAILPSMFISWHDLNARVYPKGKTKSKDVESSNCRQVLNNVFGCANPGEVLAIMGSSGAGKTTLLNILTQKNLAGLHVEGHIRVNGEPATNEYMKKFSAYVQQDDCFIGSLTVEEHLLFNASLRMGHRYSKQDRITRVQQLGLKEAASSIIGTRTRKGLSGGEKKRLAFASEILTSPPILFCDEPTSGLDAFLAFQVVSVLKQLAQKKKMTIILTIHQPSSQVFQLFDRIYLLAEGQTAFCGDPAAAEELWQSVGRPLPLNFNPADHFIATLSIMEPSDRPKVMEICKAFAKSDYGKELLHEVRSDGNSSNGSLNIKSPLKEEDNLLLTKKETYRAGWFHQLAILTWRNSKTTLREPTLIRVQIMQAIIISLITGIVYLDNGINQQHIMNLNGAMFQMITNMAFMFQYSSVYNFCLEFPTFHREHGSNLYSVSTYFLSKNIAEFPCYTLCSIIFSSIFYWMSGMVPAIDAFGIYLLAAMLVMNVSVSIGYAFACIFGTVQMAHTFLPIYITPMFAFGGFFINQDTLPIFFSPFKYLSHIRYGFEMVASNEWTRIPSISDCDETSTCVHNGSEALSNLGFKESSIWPDALILVGLFIVIRFIGFVALFMRSKLKK